MNYPLLIVLASLAGFAAFAHGGPHDVARERAKGFARGINLSHWYAQTLKDYAEPYLASYITDADFALIRDMGFDHVRLTLDDQPLFDPANPGTLKPEALERFAQRVQSLLDHDLNVIIDLHPDDGYKRSLKDADTAAAFAQDWGALAGAFADIDPQRLMFEVLNEPANDWTTQAWRPVQLRAVEAIRAAAPHHTIVVAGGKWTGYEQLAELEPYDIDNLVYTFHWYEPHLYTHQAANWGWEATRHVSGLTWPLPPEAADTAQQHTDNPESLRHLRYQIEHGWFTRDWAAAKLDEVVAWQQKHGNPPVYVGEFGVYRKESDAAGRYRWHAEMTDLFEERGWGWAMWDYSGGFAVTAKLGQRAPRHADEQMVEALGLRK